MIQPRCDERGADYRCDGHDQPGGDLDTTDEVHEVLGGARGDVVDPPREVVGPVDGPVEELVDPEQDRRGREADA
jgi:hypothetical protein